jgi:hypothetical protein
MITLDVNAHHEGHEEHEVENLGSNGFQTLRVFRDEGIIAQSAQKPVEAHENRAQAQNIFEVMRCTS